MPSEAQLFEEVPDEYGEGATLVCRIRGCDGVMAVIHELYVPLGTGKNYEPAVFGPEMAITSHWRVECAYGHVHAVSRAEESGEPFYLDAFISGGDMPTGERHEFVPDPESDECRECSLSEEHPNHAVSDPDPVAAEVRLNYIAAAVAASRGFHVPLSVRYAAAELADAAVVRWMADDIVDAEIVEADAP